MTKKQCPVESDNPDVAAMREWLDGELRGLAKMLELRSKEATRLVMDYAEGKIERKDITDLVLNYQERWGVAEMPGIVMKDGVRDEEILAAVNEHSFGDRATSLLRGRNASRQTPEPNGPRRTR